jgi:hypothetical protein
MAQFTIRIPDNLRDRIKAAADEDMRTMNGEIEWLLAASLNHRETGRTPGGGYVLTDDEAAEVLRRSFGSDPS